MQGLDYDFRRLDATSDAFYRTPQAVGRIEFHREQQRKQLDPNKTMPWFDMAFNKCARSSLYLGNVPNMNSLTTHDLRNALLACLDEAHRNVYLGVFLMPAADDGYAVRAAVITLAMEGHDVFAILNQLVKCLQNKQIMAPFVTYPLKLLSTGFQPTLPAVKMTMEEARYVYHISNPQTPIAMEGRQEEEEEEPMSGEEPQIYEALWPPVINIADPRAPVLDANNAYLAKKRSDLSRKLSSLQASFSAPKETRGRGMFDYGYIKWSLNKDYLLGTGSEAKVYLGLLKREGQEEVPVAVKMSLNNMLMEDARERDFCMQYAGESIVRYFGCDTFEDGHFDVNILIQDLGVCSLLDLIESDNLTDVERFRIVLAMLTAVEELHRCDPPILHRDIHPRNFIVMRDGKVKLTDLGLAVQVRNKHRESVTVRGVLTHGQPYEVLQAYNLHKAKSNQLNDSDENPDEEFRPLVASKSGDIFMLGCAIASLYGEVPFVSDDAILRKEPPRLSAELQVEVPWLANLLKHMLGHDVNERPKIEEIQKHPFILSTPNLNGFLLSHFLERIHRVIVSDFYAHYDRVVQGPRDDEEFRAMERSLLRIEETIANAQLPWHKQLPENVVRGNKPQYPYNASSPTVRFLKIGDEDLRPFPLVHLARFVVWIRNMLVHFGRNAKLNNITARAKPGGGVYKYPGLFFATHPVVEWLFTKHWEQVCIILRDYERKKREEIERHEEALDALQRETKNSKMWMGF